MAAKRYQYLTLDEELAYGRQVQKMLKTETEATEKGINTKELRSTLKRKIENPELKQIRDILDEGDQAVEALIEANTGLVIDRSKRFKDSYPSGPELEDIIQDGMAGLVRAVYKYDPSRGLKFSTMAVPWIFQSISRNANQTSRPIRLPENRVDQLSKIMRMRREHSDSHLSPQEVDDKIRKKLGLTREIFNAIINASNALISLNVEVRDGETHKELGDLLDLNQVPSVEDHFAKTNMHNELVASIHSLDETSIDIILSSFSLSIPGYDAMKPKEVREKWGISAKAYNSRMKKALESLKTSMRGKGLSYSDITT